MKDKLLSVLNKIYFPLFLAGIVFATLLYVKPTNNTNQSSPNLDNTILTLENNKVKTNIKDLSQTLKPAINFNNENNSACLTREKRSLSVSDSLRALGIKQADIDYLMKDYVKTINLIEDESHQIINVGMMTYGGLMENIRVNLKQKGAKENDIEETISFISTRLQYHMGIKHRPDIDKICLGTVNDILFVSYVKGYVSYNK